MSFSWILRLSRFSEVLDACSSGERGSSA